jgi:hypothetical protein
VIGESVPFAERIAATFGFDAAQLGSGRDATTRRSSAAAAMAAGAVVEAAVRSTRVRDKTPKVHA